MADSQGADSALFALLQELSRRTYRFVTPTPETHRRVVARPAMASACDLCGIFGWCLPFDPTLLPAALAEPLRTAGMVAVQGAKWKSRIRVSSLNDQLFLHSAYPTDRQDSVFLGPDSYRFVRFLHGELRGLSGVRDLVDIGAGAGVGAIASAPLVPGARITLTDINPMALRFARINARHAGVVVEAVESAGLDSVPGTLDLVIANPPFIMDSAARAYRHGGAMHGAGISLEWTLAAARRIVPGGRMLLYTGSAIIEGRDRLEEELRAKLPLHGCSLRYAEIDPDIFGEELDQPGYEQVERIAAIGAVIVKHET